MVPHEKHTCVHMHALTKLLHTLCTWVYVAKDQPHCFCVVSTTSSPSDQIHSLARICKEPITNCEGAGREANRSRTFPGIPCPQGPPTALKPAVCPFFETEADLRTSTVIIPRRADEVKIAIRRACSQH